MSENNLSLGFAFVSSFGRSLALPSRIGKFQAVLNQNLEFDRVDERLIPLVPLNSTHYDGFGISDDLAARLPSDSTIIDFTDAYVQGNMFSPENAHIELKLISCDKYDTDEGCASAEEV